MLPLPRCWSKRAGNRESAPPPVNTRSRHNALNPRAVPTSAFDQRLPAGQLRAWQLNPGNSGQVRFGRLKRVRTRLKQRWSPPGRLLL